MGIKLNTAAGAVEWLRDKARVAVERAKWKRAERLHFCADLIAKLGQDLADADELYAIMPKILAEDAPATHPKGSDFVIRMTALQDAREAAFDALDAADRAVSAGIVHDVITDLIYSLIDQTYGMAEAGEIGWDADEDVPEVAESFAARTTPVAPTEAAIRFDTLQALHRKMTDQLGRYKTIETRRAFEAVEEMLGEAEADLGGERISARLSGCECLQCQLARASAAPWVTEGPSEVSRLPTQPEREVGPVAASGEPLADFMLAVQLAIDAYGDQLTSVEIVGSIEIVKDEALEVTRLGKARANCA